MEVLDATGDEDTSLANEYKGWIHLDSQLFSYAWRYLIIFFWELNINYEQNNYAIFIGGFKIIERKKAMIVNGRATYNTVVGILYLKAGKTAYK